jgi:hypothetical protein
LLSFPAKILNKSHSKCIKMVKFPSKNRDFPDSSSKKMMIFHNFHGFPVPLTAPTAPATAPVGTPDPETAEGPGLRVE